MNSEQYQHDAGIAHSPDEGVCSDQVAIGPGVGSRAKDPRRSRAGGKIAAPNDCWYPPLSLSHFSISAALRERRLDFLFS